MHISFLLLSRGISAADRTPESRRQHPGVATSPRRKPQIQQLKLFKKSCNANAVPHPPTPCNKTVSPSVKAPYFVWEDVEVSGGR